MAKRPVMRRAACEVPPEGTNCVDSDDLVEDTGPLLVPPHVNVGIPVLEAQSKRASNHWVSKSARALSPQLPVRGP